MSCQPAASSVFQLRDEGVKVPVWGIDITNFCDAQCWYCPHPEHKRKRGHISDETFLATLDIMSNDKVNLHFFSEPLLHPHLERLVAMATERGIQTGFSTNARLLTQEKLDNLAANGLKWLRVHTNAHKRDRVPFGRRVKMFVVPDGLVMTEHRVGDGGETDGLLVDVPDKGMTSQGGHVELGLGKKPLKRCSYLGTDKWNAPEWHVVLWDGSFAMCCVDIEGTFDKKLCESCDGVQFKSPEIIGDPYADGNIPEDWGYIDA